MMNELPHSPDSERVVLACLLLDGIDATEQCNRLRSEMFSLDSHQRIYNALCKLIESGAQPDYMALADVLRKDGALENVGGIAYLTDLPTGVPAHYNPTHHIETIIEKWKLRRGLQICERYSMQFQAETPSDEALSRMQADVFDALMENSQREDPHVSAYAVQVLDKLLDYSAPPEGMTYGHTRLDRNTLGMQPGEVTVGGGRSGVGKSSLGIRAGWSNARKGIPVVFFSLEMGRETVMCRLLALESGLTYKAIRQKLLNPMQRQELTAATGRLSEMPFYIYDDAEMTLGRIAAAARFLARRHGVKLVIVDYAQIVNADGKDERTRVANVSRTLTKLAKTEGVHLVLLSQLRKVPPADYNNPPHIGDLRETGQLENDAHVVILAHRGWDETENHLSYEGMFYLPKQRNGATGSFPVRFNPDNLSFEEA
jgi:replicative DNA helicase